MNAAKLTGVFVGAFIGIVLVFAILKLTKTDKSNKCKYDERQQQVRGKAYQYGFFSMMGMCALNMVLDAGEIKLPLNTITTQFLPIFVGVAVYVGYCIMKDSYFALNENRKAILITFFGVGAINIFSGMMQIKDSAQVVNGMTRYNCVNLLCGILFVVIFILLLIKGVMDKREHAR